MSSGHDDHHVAGHGPEPMDWLAEHTASFILPFGQWIEKRIEKHAHLIHASYKQVGLLYVIVAAAVIALALGLYVLQHLFS